jgi:hypothetical protein
MPDPIAELGGKTWDELEVREHESGRLMFPDKLRKRSPKGALVETPVQVCIPQPADHFRSRVEARAWFGRLEGLDPDRDKDLFDELEQICLLARSIRTFEAPYAQLLTGEELAAYDEATLHDIQERINVYKTLQDPRDSVQTEADFWRLVVAVARSASLLPLVDIAAGEQAGSIVRMAKELCRSPRARPWLQSFGISIPEESN